MGKVIICSACESSNLDSVVKAGFSFYKCRTCGLMQRVGPISELHYEKNYYLRKEAKNKYGIYVWSLSRYPENIKLISKIIKFVPPPAILLDIGCSYGFFLEEARHFGYETLGVELSHEAIQYANLNHLKIFKTIDEVFENNIKPKVITFWHSLEHFVNPLETLQKVSSLLDKQGIVLIRVPDAGSLMSKLFDKFWVWFQPNVHIFHFTKKSLKALIERSGFEIIELRSQRPNNFLTFFAEQISVCTLTRYLRHRRSLRTTLGRLYEFLTGVELFAIAKKRD